MELGRAGIEMMWRVDGRAHLSSRAVWIVSVGAAFHALPRAGIA